MALWGFAAVCGYPVVGFFSLAAFQYLQNALGFQLNRPPFELCLLRPLVALVICSLSNFQVAALQVSGG